MVVTLPNFLLVGAAKSGTTSLYYYLKQHEEVYMSRAKEPRFFVSDYYRNRKLNTNDPLYEDSLKSVVLTFKDYIELFKDTKKEKAIGEASVEYLYLYEIAIPNIKRYLGDITIVIILRNPVERAYSAYIRSLRDQFESLPFEKCLEIEEERRKANWTPAHFYKDLGFYHKQVGAYLRSFPRVRVYLYDDLMNKTTSVIKDMYEFLEVDSSSVPDVNTKYNVSGIPKSRFFHGFLTKQNLFKSMIKPIVKVVLSQEEIIKLQQKLITKNLNSAKPEMKSETLQYVRSIYREDILKLQDLIKRDLGHWLK